ncbi:hypothetical protein QN277_024363 [Acacia crassicarpa]|uniref:Plant bHLH transcription factor ACT-like domain-containing protein n=1 Tax=Acacia crassicarpa TaxID=499986 RepID=A0AAE1MN06_9FABA|nr:hypothetical protein QN277_024363 [Acacia crassicarpa]
MDINTNLEKAIDYVIYLEERVRELEQKQSNNTSGKKAAAAWGHNGNYYDGGGSSSSRCCEEWCVASLPEVKARFSENEVLIIIHCEKQKGIMNKILAQLENLHLSVISSSVLPFGKFTLDVTIVAQMGEEFNSTVSAIAKSLRQAISNSK